MLDASEKSQAARVDLKGSDAILAVDGHTVNDISQFQDHLPSAGSKPVRLLIWRARKEVMLNLPGR